MVRILLRLDAHLALRRLVVGLPAIAIDGAAEAIPLRDPGLHRVARMLGVAIGSNHGRNAYGPATQVAGVGGEGGGRY